MLFINKVMFCDCCNRMMTMFDTGHRESWCYAYRAETTEGRKWLCWECMYCYNILDRLPSEYERSFSPAHLKKVAEREAKTKRNLTK